MFKRKILSSIEAGLRNGKSKSEIYRELGGTSYVAHSIAATPHFEDRRKYATQNWILVLIIAYYAALKLGFSLYAAYSIYILSAARNPSIPFVAVALLHLPSSLLFSAPPIFVAIQISRFRGLFYLIAALAGIAIIGFGIRLGLTGSLTWMLMEAPVLVGVLLAFYLKQRLCPYLRYFGAKTDSSGRYLFLLDEEETAEQVVKCEHKEPDVAEKDLITERKTVRVRCPSCNYTAEVDECKVPVSTTSAKCPKCNASFQLSLSGSGAFCCPKCKAGQDPTESCVRCGLIFAKYKEPKPLPQQLLVSNKVPAEDSVGYLRKSQRVPGTPTFAYIIIGVLVCCIAAYMYNGGTGFLDVKENPSSRIEVEGEVAKGNAPCPKVAMKQAKMKFLDIAEQKGKKILWYKIILERPEFEGNDARSAAFFYSISFRLTLRDEKGAVVASADTPGAFLHDGRGEHIYMNNPFSFPLATAERTKSVHVTYVVSAYRR
jgi:hypothetical protein